MKKYFLQLLMAPLLVLLSVYDHASLAGAGNKADKDTENWRYELSCEQIAMEGTKQIKVWSYSRNPGLALEQAKKNAVHGVIFKGFAGNPLTGCPSQKALADGMDTEGKHAAFFRSFFADGGAYMKYVNVVTEEASWERIRIGKEYKVAVIVTVMYSQLRRDLEREHIIKSLDSGF